MKVIAGIFIGILSVVVIMVLVAGYFGFVPGISNIFGSNKPIDLGTTYTAADYQSAIAKTGIQFSGNTSTVYYDVSQKTYGTPKAVTADFTAAELTAAFNDKPNPPDFPIKDFQMRINPDGTEEYSALIFTDNLSSYAASQGISNDAIQQILDLIKKFGLVEKQIPIYYKGTGSVVNGNLDFNITELKIGRLSISADTINSHKADILNFKDNYLLNAFPGYSCQNASVVNGEIHFEGTFPSSIALK